MSDINWADFKPAPDQPISGLVAAITHVESGGDSGAVSSQGATGSMQIMPATFRQYAAAGEDYGDDTARSAAAVRKIVDDYVHFKGDASKTAAAYIGGRGAVRDDGTIRDDVADANGTTPAAYARTVAARMGAGPAVDWSQFSPADHAQSVDWSQFKPVESSPNVAAGPADLSDPLTRITPSTGGEQRPTFTVMPEKQAGGGRGFVNPPMQTPDQGREVGALESLERGFGRAGAETARLPSLLASAAGVAWDKLHGAVSGKDETGAQDWMFRNLVDPRQQAVDWYALGPNEKQTFLGKIADGVGAMAQDLPLMIASGGTKQRMEMAQQFPTMARYLENAVSAGYDAMRPIMVKAGTEKAKQVLDAGGTTAQAMTSATTAALWTGLSGGQPMSAEGTLLQRLATGFPVGMAQEEAGRAVQNAADPAALQRPFDPAEMLAGGATNTIAAGAMGHAGPGHAPDRIALGYDPLTGKTPVAETVQGMGQAPGRFEPGRAEPAADPITRIAKAATVDEAIQAAQEAVDSHAPVAEAIQPLGKTLEQELAELRQRTAAPELPEAATVPEPEIKPAEASPEPVAAPQAAAGTEPAATWFGRAGDGYKTAGDAQMALPSRLKVAPDLGWKIEQMPNGKFRLAGYAGEGAESLDGQQAAINAGADDSNRNGAGPGALALAAGLPADGSDNAGVGVRGADTGADGNAVAGGQVLTSPTREEVAQTHADAGVSASGARPYQMERTPSGSLIVRGDKATIREALANLPPEATVSTRDGIQVATTWSERAERMLQSFDPAAHSDFNGKKVSIKVEAEDGTQATLKMDAGRALRATDARERELERLRECVGAA